MQDEFTSVIFSMPKAAIGMGIMDRVASLPDIVDEIIRVL